MTAVEGWETKQLRELSDIRVSNVDKKFYAREKPVKLCNYMDVYTNEYVTDRIQFMEASATSAEIDRFSLKIGDVIITKDSETPDDIGIPAVIAEQIKGLLCGYHLALIRPNKDNLDSIYLAKQLSTARVARYFALHASGSTRYGLSISAIESVEIPTPPKPEQIKIAEILSTVDRAIEQTEALIAKQQRIKTGLMQDLLTRGIDEHETSAPNKPTNSKTRRLARFRRSGRLNSLGKIPI
jgi:type I restriction enzyme S subunit